MPRETCRPLHARFYDALGRINQVSPVDAWPPSILKLMKNGLTLDLNERAKLVCFFWGNGSNENDIGVLLGHKLRDDAARTHVGTLIADCTNPDKKHRLFYYDVGQGDCLDMAGRPYGDAYGSRAIRRKLNAWDAYASRNTVTYAMQEDFFSQSDCIDPKLYFTLYNS